MKYIGKDILHLFHRYLYVGRVWFVTGLEIFRNVCFNSKIITQLGGKSKKVLHHADAVLKVMSAP